MGILLQDSAAQEGFLDLGKGQRFGPLLKNGVMTVYVLVSPHLQLNLFDVHALTKAAPPLLLRTFDRPSACCNWPHRRTPATFYDDEVLSAKFI